MSSNTAGPVHVLTSTTAEKLAQMIARVERLEEEKAETAADIKEVYAEAKALGFDTKAMRAVIRARKKDQQERETEAAMFDLYAGAIERVKTAVSAL